MIRPQGGLCDKIWCLLEMDIYVIIYCMSKRKESRIYRRTMHYFFEATKKYKWYAICGLICTPIVIFLRSILVPLIFADMIDAIASGMRGEELFNVLFPTAVILV